jgi:hypothetical protein
LKNVKWKTPDRRDKTPERNPTPLVCKSEPQTPQNAGKTNPTMKFEPITPKTPLEERVIKFSYLLNWVGPFRCLFPE